MSDYEGRYYKTLDQLTEVREERDTLFKALKETQKQLDLARAMVSAYRHEKEAEDDGE